MDVESVERLRAAPEGSPRKSSGLCLAPAPSRAQIAVARARHGDPARRRVRAGDAGRRDRRRASREGGTPDAPPGTLGGGVVADRARGLVGQPSGFYPYFDSVYSGGGFTLGAGYRQFTGDRTNVNVAGLYSVPGYKLIEAGASSPGHWRGRLDLHASAGWRDATQVAYHGLGIDSPADPGTAFRMQQAYGGGDLTLRPVRWLLFTAGVAYEDYTLKDPTGDFIPVEGSLHARHRPWCRRRSGVRSHRRRRRHRLASGGGLCAARQPVPGDAS